MRKVVWLLLVAILLCGCAGVSQKDYDSVCEERDELKKENESAGRLLELNKKASEYKAKIEAEYEHALFVLHVSEKVSSVDVGEQKEGIYELKDNAIKSLDTTINTYSLANSAMEISEDTYNSTMEMIESVNEAWEKTYNIIENVEKSLMEN